MPGLLSCALFRSQLPRPVRSLDAWLPTEPLRKLVTLSAGMRRQDTPFPTHGLGSPEPELSVEHLKQQIFDKDSEILALRVRDVRCCSIKDALIAERLPMVQQ